MNKDYKLIKEFKCMNETPALMPVNIHSLVGKKWRKKKKQVRKEMEKLGSRKFEKTT